MLRHSFKKALIASAFFVSGLGINDVQAKCSFPSQSERVSVRQVLDGDTLLLSDRRRVRLIGINTPELDGDGDLQRWAHQAKTVLEAWVADSEGDVVIYPGLEKRDAYGRVLAYVSDLNGVDLAERLLKKGLAFSIAMAPEVRKKRCYFSAEQVARKARLGVWGGKPTRARDLKEGGFSLLKGMVSHQWRLKTVDVLVLDNKLAVVFKRIRLPVNILGQTVEVRGWVVTRSFKRDRLSFPYTIYLNDRDNLLLIEQD